MPTVIFVSGIGASERTARQKFEKFYGELMSRDRRTDLKVIDGTCGNIFNQGERNREANPTVISIDQDLLTKQHQAVISSGSLSNVQTSSPRDKPSAANVSKRIGMALLDHGGDSQVNVLRGNVLFYLAKGKAIRDAIQGQVQEVPENDPVVLVGDSLGGIACLELLVEVTLPRVTRLITSGSQATQLYEMSCLSSLPYNAEILGEYRLPEHMPTWTNFYDPQDLQSTSGQEIFGQRIEEIEVHNEHPSFVYDNAYWDNPAVYQEIMYRLH
jgi:hypothetical protein